MGLDMYLTGEKFYWQSFKGRDRKEDGYAVQSIYLRLGYWRKHPILRGFIVQAFADGKDECQKIVLDERDLMTIIHAITEGRLPHTEGFFFGESEQSREQTKHDLDILCRAVAWLREGDDSPVQTGFPTAVGPGMTMMEVKLKDKDKDKDDTAQKVTREVVYQASW